MSEERDSVPKNIDFEYGQEWYKTSRIKQVIELETSHELRQVVQLLVSSIAAFDAGCKTPLFASNLNCVVSVGSSREGDELDVFSLCSGIRSVSNEQERRDMAFVTVEACRQNKFDKSEIEEGLHCRDVLFNHSQYNHDYEVPLGGHYCFATCIVVAALVEDDFIAKGRKAYTYVGSTVDSSKQTHYGDPSGEITLAFCNDEAYYKTIVITYDHQIFLDDLIYLKAYAAMLNGPGTF